MSFKSTLPEDFIDNCRWKQADEAMEIRFFVDEYTKRRRGEFIYTVTWDGPLEIYDVMASRDDIVVEIEDPGRGERIARVAGPWLKRRDVALAEYLQVLSDALQEHRDGAMLDVTKILRQVIEASPQAITRPLVIAPRSSARFTVYPPEDQDLDSVTVWMRAVQWVARL